MVTIVVTEVLCTRMFVKDMSELPSPRWRSVAVVGMCLVNFVPGSASAGASPTRVERCKLLQNQLAEELEAHAKSSSYQAAAGMEAKAKKLCAGGKQAQGIRLLAVALRKLGVQPLDPK